MAIIWHYVASDGTDTWANSTNSGTPCSLDTALANVAAGIGLYVKAGTYSRGAADTVTADGTAVSPIMMVGCDASWNVITPSRSTTTKLIDASAYPVISYGANNYQWSAGGADYWVYRNIKFVGARAGAQFNIGSNCYMYGCVIINNASNASAVAYASASGGSVADNCDFAQTDGTGLCGASIIGSNRLVNCIIYDSGGDGIQIGGSGCFVSGCLIYGHDDYGIKITTTTTSHWWHIERCTIYGAKGFIAGNAAYTAISYVGCCHITDGAEEACQSPNGTGSPIVLSHNRCRDNTPDSIDWAGDYVVELGGTDTTTGDQATDYKAYASQNFTLVTTAPGVTLGQFGQPVGALPPEDWPALSSVLSTDTMNGDAGTATAGEGGLANRPFASIFFK